jgi:hypothetical protein
MLLAVSVNSQPELLLDIVAGSAVLDDSKMVFLGTLLRMLPPAMLTRPTAVLCCLCPAAKIAIIVVCAVSALIVVVLSAVYTKRAIDKRLASVHIEEEVQVEEQHQHYLLGSGSQSGDGDTDEELGARSGPPAVAAAGGEDGLHSSGSGVRRGVLVSVETPMLVVHRTSINGGSSRAKQQPQQQQQLRTVAVDSRQPGWGARVTQKLGFGAGSSMTAKPRKLKVSEDLGGDSFVVPRHGDPHGVGGDGGSASSSSSNRVNRDMH